MMAARTPREPSNEDARDGEVGGDEGILEIALMPRNRANSENAPLRGNNGEFRAGLRWLDFEYAVGVNATTAQFPFIREV